MLLEKLNATIAGQETLQKYIAEKNAEIERLIEERTEIENKIDKIYPRVMELPKAMQTAKSEAIKEFAERLKAEFLNDEQIVNMAWVNAINHIDNLVKEMVGDAE